MADVNPEFPVVVDTEAGGPAPVDNGGDAGSPRKAGRKSKEQEIADYLATNRLVPASDDSSGPSGGPEVAGSEPIDEAGTRAGIEMLVETAEAVAVGYVTDKALIICRGDKDKAGLFGERAVIKDKTKTVLINSAVAVCSKHGVNMGPETPLVAALLKVGYDWKCLISELSAIAASVTAQPPAN